MALALHAPPGNTPSLHLNALSGVWHGCGCLCSDSRHIRRPFTPRCGLLQSRDGERPFTVVIAVAVDSNRHMSTQVQTAGGDFLHVHFVASGRAGECSSVRVTGSYVEVFHGAIDVAVET